MLSPKIPASGSTRRQFLRWTGFAAGAAVVGGPLLAACDSTSASSSSASTSSITTATLGCALASDPNGLDPANVTTTQATQLDLLMLETLTTYKQTGTLEPLLATDWVPNATQDNWTFTLRAGVKFQDGTPFNADAVMKSITRSIDPTMTTTALGSLQYIKSVEAIDDTHVKFTLKQPVRYFPSSLCNVVASITSPSSWTANGNTYAVANKIVGTGPYKLTSYQRNDHVSMTRNDDYWGRKPPYKNQIFYTIPDANAREAALRSGQVDVIVDTSAPSIASLKADREFTVLEKYGDRISHIHLNTTSTAQPALQDVRVRQALNYAVDKQAIVKSILFGLGQEMDSPLGDSTWFGYSKTGPYPYDPDMAKQLLREAGASNLHLSMLTTNGNWLQDDQTTVAVASYLSAVGVVVDGPTVNDTASTLNILEAPAKTGDPNPQDESSYWSFTADFPDASQILERNYASWSIPPNSGNNFSRYSNPTVDALLRKGAADHPAQAQKDYADAEKIIWDDAPMIYLFSLPFIVATSSKVQGVTVAPPNQVMNTIYASPKD